MGLSHQKKLSPHSAVNRVLPFAHSLLLLTFFSSCEQEKKGESTTITFPGGSGEITIPNECRGLALCQGTLARYCPGASNEVIVDCTQNGGQCVAGRGCTLCEPNTLYCEGTQVMSCTPDGLGKELVTTCPRDCLSGRCVDPCGLAAEQRSYQGCEYWPTPLANEVSKDFSYAVGVVNVNDEPLVVTIEHGGNLIRNQPIAPRALEIIELPWIDGLTPEVNNSDGIQTSVQVPAGAYHLKSDLPVIVYQFSPLQYTIPRDCLIGDQSPGDGECFSYTNDASLLLPAHALGTEYFVISYPSLAVDFGNGISQSPSSFQIVATSEGQTVMSITFNSAVAASLDGRIRSFSAGQTGDFTLIQGEVLQFTAAEVTSCLNPSSGARGVTHCDVGDSADLSGTYITSSKPIEVFGSHSCAFIPFNVFACDHLEESIFPLSSWGRTAVVPAIRPLINEPSVIRIISGVDGNQLSFSPSSVHPAVTLNRGDLIEFESREGFIVTGSGVLQVAQFLVGQNYTNQDNDQGYGDPSLSLIPPSDQFRSDYTILAPQSYDLHFINIAYRNGAQIQIDGNPIPEGTHIGQGSWRSTSIEVGGGVHQLSGSDAFGVWVYGFGRYTSYMYPGGLDLKEINDVQ